MTEPARSAKALPAEAAAGPLRPTEGLRLLGEYQGSGFTEPRFLVRRRDGQVIQLSRLLYLVTAAIVEGGAADRGWDASRVAARAADGFGREITADNVRYLVTGKLGPLGVVRTGDPHQEPAAPDDAPRPAPRSNLLLVLKIRGVLLRPRAAGAVGGALAWLHYPPLVAVVLAGFAAFETWLFAVHGAIGPLLGVLNRPVLFLAVAGLTLASLLFHEFGHASACRYGGARPGVIGFGLYLIWPSLYTDVTDAYRLDRAGRLRTDLGGVYFNAIFILALSGGYAATGQPVFLAAAFLDNFQILQQLVPLVRMDGYFILADLAGVPDLLGLLGPIMASLLPGAAARRAGARARGLRRGPRVMVTAWVVVAIPLLAAVAGYTLWNLPALAVTTARSFSNGLIGARAAFSAGHPAAALAALLGAVLLVIPVAALAYLLARIVTRGASAVIRQGDRLLSRIPAPAFMDHLWPARTPAPRRRRGPGHPQATVHRRAERAGGHVGRSRRSAGRGRRLEARGTGDGHGHGTGGHGEPRPGRGVGRPAGEPGRDRVLRPADVRAGAEAGLSGGPADGRAASGQQPARFRCGRRHPGDTQPVRHPPGHLLRTGRDRRVRLGRRPGRGPRHRAGRGRGLQVPARVPARFPRLRG